MARAAGTEPSSRGTNHPWATRDGEGSRGMVRAPGSRPRRGRRPDSPGSKTRGTSRIDDRTPEGCHNPLDSPDSATPPGSAGSWVHLSRGLRPRAIASSTPSASPRWRFSGGGRGMVRAPGSRPSSRGTNHPRATRDGEGRRGMGVPPDRTVLPRKTKRGRARALHRPGRAYDRARAQRRHKITPPSKTGANKISHSRAPVPPSSSMPVNLSMKSTDRTLPNLAYQLPPPPPPKPPPEKPPPPKPLLPPEAPEDLGGVEAAFATVLLIESRSLLKAYELKGVPWGAAYQDGSATRIPSNARIQTAVKPKATAWGRYSSKSAMSGCRLAMCSSSSARARLMNSSKPSA